MQTCLWVACKARGQPGPFGFDSVVVRVRAGAEVSAFPRLAFMVLHFMAKSNQVVPKKRRGRPATGRDPVTAIRLSKELRATVDKWAASQDDEPGRSEAIRRLVEIGLKAKGK
jgi:hypothetical protein